MNGEDRKPVTDDPQGRLLMRWIHGDLAADEARAVERRIAEDPGLAARHHRLAAAWEDLRLPASAGAPEGFRDGAVAAARRLAGELTWSLAPVWARAGSLAALIIGLVLGTSFATVDHGGLSESRLTVDQDAYALLAEPSSLAESFWLTLEESEGSLADGNGNGGDGGERVP